MEENKQTNQSGKSEIYNLGSGDKRPNILGKLLGSAFGGLPLTTDAAKLHNLKTEGSKLGAAIGNQMQQEAKQTESQPITSIAELLGPRPDFDPIAIEERNRRNESRARSLFYSAVVFALIIFGFFQFQLNPDVTILLEEFGPNSATQFEQSNAEIKKLQTDSNIIQHRIARLWIDIVNEKIDVYAHAVAQISSGGTTISEKTIAENDAIKLASEIKNALSAVQKIFSQDYGIDTYTPLPVSFQEREAEFIHLLKEALKNEQHILRGAAQAGNGEQQDDVRSINDVLRLVENKRVRALIRSSQFKQLSHENLVKLLADIRSEGIDEFAQIEKLKQQRVDWETLINNIHHVVQTADPHYGHGLFKTVGGFMFSSYRFDEKTSRVSISGVTRTSDTNTFTFIATLIDAIEKSPYFKDIDFRSFSKARDESGNFSAGINLDFGIEEGEIDTNQ